MRIVVSEGNGVLVDVTFDTDSEAFKSVLEQDREIGVVTLFQAVSRVILQEHKGMDEQEAWQTIFKVIEIMTSGEEKPNN